jgi:hypothetical protein
MKSKTAFQHPDTAWLGHRYCSGDCLPAFRSTVGLLLQYRQAFRLFSIWRKQLQWYEPTVSCKPVRRPNLQKDRRLRIDRILSSHPSMSAEDAQTIQNLFTDQPEEARTRTKHDRKHSDSDAISLCFKESACFCEQDVRFTLLSSRY